MPLFEALVTLTSAGDDVLLYVLLDRDQKGMLFALPLISKVKNYRANLAKVKTLPQFPAVFYVHLKKKYDHRES